jgi:hypothetical protein
MTTPQKLIYDCTTGETITRDYNSEELDQLAKDTTAAKLEKEAKLKAEEARDRKRQEVLDRLGITAEELKTILS